MGIVGFWLIMTTRRKWLTLFLIAALAVAFTIYAPEQWTDRLSTIQEADQDDSFMGRVIAWRVSSALALSNPVFGGGFHSVQVQYVWDIFKSSPGLLGFLNLPIPEFSAKAAHSIYFEVMGDMGFVGLLIFMTILLQSIYSRFAIKRMVATLGNQYTWARDLADMLMLAVIAYMAGGAAVSLAYLEVIYMIIMLMELLRLHVVRALASNSLSATSAPQKEKL
jgi:probable O-glycosylation ligase (exosortase A-associated)